MDEVMQNWPARLCACTAIAAAVAAGPTSQPTVRPATASAATTLASMPMAEFTDDIYHFHLKYPTNWKRVDPPVNSQVLSMQTAPGDPKDSHFAVIGLRIQAGPASASDPQILKDVSGEMVGYTFNHGGKKVTVKPDKLGDLPARRILFDLEKAEGSTRVMCIVAVRKGTEYVFTIAAPTEIYDRIAPGVDEMAKSFDLTE